MSESSASTAAPGRPRSRAAVLLLVLLALLFFWRLGAVPLLDPDEGRYTEIPREMLASGDLVTPRLDGVLYFEKPPLVYWLNASAIAVFGLNEFGARLPSAALGLAGVGLAYLLGCAMADRRAGLIAAAVLGTTPFYVALARLATTDMTLTFCLTATLTCFWLAHRAEDKRRARWLWLGAFGGAALAMLAKGLVGIVIPGAIVFLYLLATRRWSVLRRVPWLAGVALFLAIAAPWHLLAAARNPDFLWFYFVHEHVLRYLTPIAERQEPLWFFAAVIVAGCAPWSGLLPSALRLLRRRNWHERDEGRDGVVFLLAWAGFVVVFFSISQSKLIPYVLPAVPPLAVLVALAIDRLLDRTLAGSRFERWGIAAISLCVGAYGALLVAGGLGRIDRPGLADVTSPALLVPGVVIAALAVAVAVASFVGDWRGRLLVLFAAACCVVVGVLAAGPTVARERSSREIARVLRPSLADGDRVFCYRDYSESLPVYLDHTVGVVGYLGELTFGASHLTGTERAERFPSVEEFRAVWKSAARVWLVASRSKLDTLDRDGLGGGRVIATTPGYALLANSAR